MHYCRWSDIDKRHAGAEPCQGFLGKFQLFGEEELGGTRDWEGAWGRYLGRVVGH